MLQGKRAVQTIPIMIKSIILSAFAVFLTHACGLSVLAQGSGNIKGTVRVASGATISGVIHVNQDSVVMDSDLPGLVTAFVSEDQIRNVINEQLDGLFPA